MAATNKHRNHAATTTQQQPRSNNHAATTTQQQPRNAARLHQARVIFNPTKQWHMQ
jgi:hypothetical protein